MTRSRRQWWTRWRNPSRSRLNSPAASTHEQCAAPGITESSEPAIRWCMVLAMVMSVPRSSSPTKMRVGHEMARAGAVNDQDVMQRHLPRLEEDVGGLRLVDLHRDLLAAGEEIVGIEGVDVGHRRPVTPGDDPHVAVTRRALGEGHPCGDHVRLAQPPVRRVLMPGD